jgi:peptidoglycan/xylan/chitin deacetylase (PgdA/CDA1 family)
MALYPYRATLTIDPATGDKALNATGEIYALADTGFSTPLAALNSTGLPVTLTSNSDGILPTFYVDDHTSVNWKSGSYVFPLVTSQSVEGPQGVGVVAVDATGDQMTFALSNDTTIGPVTLPAGPGGSDTGVAGYINTASSETRAALDATIAKSPGAARRRISAKGAITISWDDGYERVHRVLFPILRNEYPNQRHTFGIISNNVGMANFVTATQVQELHAAGHEIASHSYSHKNVASSTLADRLVEYDTSKSDLELMIGAPVTTWIYPEGHLGRSAQTDQELYGRYNLIVNAGQSGGASMIPLPRRTGLFIVPRTAAWTSATHQTVLERIRRVAMQPVILNLYSHRPGDGPTGGTSGGGAADVTEAEIREALTLIEDLGIPVVNIRDACPGQPILGNPGAEAGDVREWTSVVSGTGKTFSAVTDTPDLGLSGGWSFKLTSTEGTGSIYAYQDIPCIEGQSYLFSGRGRRVNTTTAGTTALRIQARDQFDVGVGSQTTAAITAADGTWQKVTAGPVVAPAGAVSYRVDMIINTHVGELYVDHLYFGPTGLGDFG